MDSLGMIIWKLIDQFVVRPLFGKAALLFELISACGVLVNVSVSDQWYRYFKAENYAMAANFAAKHHSKLEADLQVNKRMHTLIGHELVKAAKINAFFAFVLSGDARLTLSNMPIVLLVMRHYGILGLRYSVLSDRLMQEAKFACDVCQVVLHHNTLQIFGMAEVKVTAMTIYDRLFSYLNKNKHHKLVPGSYRPTYYIFLTNSDSFLASLNRGLSNATTCSLFSSYESFYWLVPSVL